MIEDFFISKNTLKKPSYLLLFFLQKIIQPVERHGFNSL